MTDNDLINFNDERNDADLFDVHTSSEIVGTLSTMDLNEVLFLRGTSAY